jgi:hypothetical protein
MEGEYVPPSMRVKNKVEELIKPIERSGLSGLNVLDKEEGVYIPSVLIKENEKKLENDFPVLGEIRNVELKSVWGNRENMDKIKRDINGVEIKSNREIYIMPEKRLKAVFYDESIEEVVEKKIILSRLKRDMDLGLVEYSEEDRVYIYNEKEEEARIAFYEPELFDILLNESEEYIEEEY